MKNIHILIIAFFLALDLNAQNPNFTWAKQLGGATGEDGLSTCTDLSGNIITTGLFNSTCDFDPGVGVSNLTSFGLTDIFVSKLDGSGNFVWAKQMGGTNSEYGYAVTTDPSGNVYITGFFDGTADFDPGVGTFNMTSNGTDDIFICKLDPSGNFVWAKQIGGSNSEQGRSIAIDAAGNVLTTGYFLLTVDFDPGPGVFNMTAVGVAQEIFVSKLDAAGNFIWAKQMSGSGSDNGLSITTDASNNVYSTGYFNGTNDFDPGVGIFNLVSAGSDEIFVSKLNSSGNFVWARKLGGTLSDYGNSIQVDGSGNVYTTGFFNGTSDFDPGVGSFTITSAGLQDIFISKLDVSGNFVWAKTIGGTNNDAGNSLVTDVNGNVYITGEFQNTPDFDPGVGTFTMTSAGGFDSFICKLDISGNYIWAGQIGGTGTDRAYSVRIDAARTIYVAGCFSSSPSDFNAGVGTFNMNTLGNDDVFITKYCQNPDQPSLINGSTNICAGSSPVYTLSLLPGATTYSWVLPGGWGGAGTSNTINPTVGSSGTISVSGVNACGTSISQTLSVTVNPNPTITVNSGSICAGNSFTMVPSGANTYTIQGGSAIVSPTATSSYTVAGTNTAGCISATSAISNVTVNALPLVGATTNNTLLCVGQSATITASGALTYTFNPGGTGTSISVSPTVTSTYTINGTDINGCSNSTAFTQSVSACTGIAQLALSGPEGTVFPNPFENKIAIVTSGVKQTIHIFNSIGQMVYSLELENEITEIDLTRLNSGIYFIKIGTTTKKLIKQ